MIVSVAMNEDIARRLEAARGSTPRSAFIRRAVEEYLEYHPPDVPLVERERGGPP